MYFLIKKKIYNFLIASFKVLHTRKHLNYTLGHAISWLHQTACAVNYLHTSNAKPILHRDLKPLK